MTNEQKFGMEGDAKAEESANEGADGWNLKPWWRRTLGRLKKKVRERVRRINQGDCTPFWLKNFPTRE